MSTKILTVYCQSDTIKKVNKNRINFTEDLKKMENNGLIYGVKDRPKFPQILLFALQQLLAIMAATIAVPLIIGNGM